MSRNIKVPFTKHRKTAEILRQRRLTETVRVFFLFLNYEENEVFSKNAIHYTRMKCTYNE